MADIPKKIDENITNVNCKNFLLGKYLPIKKILNGKIGTKNLGYSIYTQ